MHPKAECRSRLTPGPDLLYTTHAHSLVVLDHVSLDGLGWLLGLKRAAGRPKDREAIAERDVRLDEQPGSRLSARRPG